MSGNAVLGQINGIDITVDALMSHLSTMPGSTVLGDLDGETVTVTDALMRLQRIAALPAMVPEKDRVSDEEWAEAVIMRGEAPYGRCPWCGTAKGTAGCLNLCDMPAAAAQSFQNEMLAFLEHRRAQVRWVEALGGCTCEPPRLTGYAIERDQHERDCRMNPANQPAPL